MKSYSKYVMINNFILEKTVVSYRSTTDLYQYFYITTLNRLLQIHATQLCRVRSGHMGIYSPTLFYHPTIHRRVHNT